jgi:hypothetical protein
MWFAKFVGGNWTKKPSELHESLSEDAKHLLGISLGKFFNNIKHNF